MCTIWEYWISSRESGLRIRNCGLCEQLAADKDHPNAVFLGRVTGDGQTHGMWYVNNPGLANTFLQSLIESGRYPFPFEFMMEEDPAWEEAHFWLDPLSK